MNILHLTPDFNYVDGRSYYVYLLLKYLKKNGHNIFLCTNRGDSFDRLKELEIPIFISESLWSKTSFWKSLNFISEIIKDNNIQILHSHHRYYELLANSLTPFKKEKKIHTVFTALSIVDKRYLVEYKSDKIIAVSNAVKEMLTQRFNVDEKRITLIPNFVDSEEPQSNEKSKIKNQKSKVRGNQLNIDNRTLKINLLSIGRFHKEKNYETLLKALILLKNYKTKLILVGEGEEKKSYEKIIRENSLNVDLIPPQRNLKVFFDTADICILPSIHDPFPGFMLQSGLHRKPFVGSNVDGIAELIRDNENGLLFEKQDNNQLAEKIKLFIKDKKLVNQCAKNLYNAVKDNYTEKSIIPKIEELYAKLIN